MIVLPGCFGLVMAFEDNLAESAGRGTIKCPRARIREFLDLPVGQFTLIRFNKLGCLRKASGRGSQGRQSINSEASVDVRSDAHYGLRSDIERCPKSVIATEAANFT
jgi:hypothetical protein